MKTNLKQRYLILIQFFMMVDCTKLPEKNSESDLESYGNSLTPTGYLMPTPSPTNETVAPVVMVPSPLPSPTPSQSVNDIECFRREFQFIDWDTIRDDVNESSSQITVYPQYQYDPEILPGSKVCVTEPIDYNDEFGKASRCFRTGDCKGNTFNFVPEKVHTKTVVPGISTPITTEDATDEEKIIAAMGSHHPTKRGFELAMRLNQNEISTTVDAKDLSRTITLEWNSALSTLMSDTDKGELKTKSVRINRGKDYTLTYSMDMWFYAKDDPKKKGGVIYEIVISPLNGRAPISGSIVISENQSRVTIEEITAGLSQSVQGKLGRYFTLKGKRKEDSDDSLSGTIVLNKTSTITPDLDSKYFAKKMAENLDNADFWTEKEIFDEKGDIPKSAQLNFRMEKAASAVFLTLIQAKIDNSASSVTHIQIVGAVKEGLFGCHATCGVQFEGVLLHDNWKEHWTAVGWPTNQWFLDNTEGKASSKESDYFNENVAVDIEGGELVDACTINSNGVLNSAAKRAFDLINRRVTANKAEYLNSHSISEIECTYPAIGYLSSLRSSWWIMDRFGHIGYDEGVGPLNETRLLTNAEIAFYKVPGAKFDKDAICRAFSSKWYSPRRAYSRRTGGLVGGNDVPVVGNPSFQRYFVPGALGWDDGDSSKGVKNPLAENCKFSVFKNVN